MWRWSADASWSRKQCGPLAGYVVVDLTRALAGPHAGMMLGDLGARVIKVETPGSGDDTRGWGPPFVAGESTYFMSCNRNKQSIALDLKSEDGRATLEALVRKADVLLENFRTGVLDRLGFTTARLLELNPRLVVLSITGFGHDGPEAGRAGYDQIAQGEAGLMPLTGSGPDDPQRVGVPISGGTRMQEGTVAFLQMVKITAAIVHHKAAGLPCLVYLRNPTFGGVFASWGSLGHVTVAEPGALIGFLGPRVYQALYGEPFPEGVQVAENLYHHGLIDAVLPPEALAGVADRALRILLPRADSPPEVADPPQEFLPDVPAWESITISRRPDRPGVRQLLRYAATDVPPLYGTGAGEKDPGLLLALARFGNAPCVLLGQDRRGQTDTSPMGPAALREARRGMRLARELTLPLVTVIDTPGAALSTEAEEGGMAGEIARCLAELITLEAPTLSLLLGQGSGGGALALIPCDRVLVAQHGWLPATPGGRERQLFHVLRADPAERLAARLERFRTLGTADRPA